ncbi:hypothetical protein [Actinoplanes sp. N902-109]|uniref:hypothetical protein n=1 Tax=Actinoplanes sp. (strain N902-109) TaxID=649831 RepID=UPI0003293CC2|nr:hypothetical protein [Actinoplanes sp. N902-109]AGL18614.1 hypothetical protein L083_5104 [Actinoplanes sp. N902-109]
MQSWLGWPVPADVRVVSGDELLKLISTAEQRGFSRKAHDLHPRDDKSFALLAYLYEGSPEASWMCLVVAISDWTPPPGRHPGMTFGRLDVAVADFASLRRAGRRQRDQLLHWTAWLASSHATRSRPGPETGSAETGGAETGGAETGGAETGGAETGGAETGSAETDGAETGSAETDCAGSG